MSVVLPQPLAPAMSRISPGWASKEMWLIAAPCRSRYRKETSSSTRGRSVISLDTSFSVPLLEQGLEGIAHLGTKLLGGAAVHDGNYEVAGTAEQRYQLAHRPFAERVHQAGYLSAI